MSQTTVQAGGQSLPFAGVLGDDSPNYVRSYVNEATNSIPFGVMVIQGTNDDQALEMAVGGQPVGVVSHSHRYAKPGQLDEDGTAGGDGGLTTETEMGVLRKGTVWVIPEDDVAPGDPVRVRHTAAGAEELGAFRTAADGTDTGVISGAAWLTSATGGTPALLEVDLTGEGVLVSD